MKKNAKITVVAAVTAGALALGALGASHGGVLALWNDGVTVDGATITSGDLNLVESGTPTWNRESWSPKPITAKNEKGEIILDEDGNPIIVAYLHPAVTMTGSQEMKLTIKGDNLVTRLIVNNVAAPLGGGSSYRYRVTNAKGVEIIPWTTSFADKSEVKNLKNADQGR